MENENLLKQQLYQNFKQSGLQSSLKAQLRQQMIQKLQKTGGIEREQIGESCENELLKRTIISIVNEYLSSEGLAYTASVFIPEVNLQKDLFGKYELVDLLSMQKEIQLDEVGKQKSALELLVKKQMGKQRNEWKNYDASTQTETSDRLMDLESKLLHVDEEFNSKMDKLKAQPQEALEERLQEYKKEIEQRSKAEMQAQIVQIRQFEIQSLKVQLADEHRIQMEQYRESIDKIYLDKLQKLRDREKETIESCKQKMTSIENAAYQHRQKVLKDFQVIKEREEELRKMKALNEETIRIERDRLKTTQNQLERKVKEMEKLEKDLKEKSDKEIAYNKMQVIKDLENEQMDLHQKKIVVDTDFSKIDNIKIQLESVQKENTLLTNENVRLVDENKEIKQKLRKLEDDTSSLRDNNRLIQDTARRDQNQLQNYENQLTILREQIAFLQQFATFQEQKNINEQAKQHNLEQLRKLQRQLDDYQMQIEEYEEKLKNIPDYEENIQKFSTFQQNDEIEKLKNEMNQEINNLLEEPSAIVDITNKTKNQILSQNSQIYTIQKDLQAIGLNYIIKLKILSRKQKDKQY